MQNWTLFCLNLIIHQFVFRSVIGSLASPSDKYFTGTRNCLGLTCILNRCWLVSAEQTSSVDKAWKIFWMIICRLRLKPSLTINACSMMMNCYSWSGRKGNLSDYTGRLEALIWKRTLIWIQKNILICYLKKWASFINQVLYGICTCQKYALLKALLDIEEKILPKCKYKKILATFF